MFDYSPSEFSRFRLQFARDRARPGATDNQIFLQYIMSLGAHGAHSILGARNETIHIPHSSARRSR